MTSSNATAAGEGLAVAAAASPLPPLPSSIASPADAQPPSPPPCAGDNEGKNKNEESGNNNGDTNTNTNASANATANADADADAGMIAGGATTISTTDAPNASLTLTLDAPTTNISILPGQSFDDTIADFPIPSPPTVSPLSTPAATHINVDDSLPDDQVARLTADLPPLSLNQESSMFRSGIFDSVPSGAHGAHGAQLGPDAMVLDEPFMPNQGSYRRSSQVEAIATTDPDPHAADFSAHNLLSGMRLSQGSIDPSAYMMNLAAQATVFNEQGPSVIHPSAVSLHSFTQDSDVLTGSAGPTSTNGTQQLESYARIEFADSTFQMTTYAVIIGRDKQAMEQARIDERREAAYKRKCEENERNGLPPPTPLAHDRGKFSKSYVSEEGGMLGPEHSDGEDFKPAKRRRPSSAAQPAVDEGDATGNHAQTNRQYVSHTPGAAAVDMGVLQPSPEHIPFIGIHSPGPDIASKTRGISRQHLKIQFNKRRGVFEGIALHKNGFFCNEVLYGLDQPATLRSGNRLQIKDVEFFFHINGVQNGMSGGEDDDVASSKRMSVGGKEMSLDFEHSDHENFRDTSEELSDIEDITSPAMKADHGEGRPAAKPAPSPEPASEVAPVAVAEQRPTQEAEPAVPGTQPISREEQLLAEILKPELDMLGELPPDFAMPEIPKRRGPGRPPKDGIMSKRERRLLKKQMQETSKKTLPQDPQEEKIKRPVGRPRKNPLPEDGDQTEKRKYNKKKREGGEEGSETEKRVKEKKDKKVRPKSPPLNLRREDYNDEQLQKPTKNYGILIHEALINGPPDGLTLKQIYKRITAKYPFFYFAETKGWESSVRHNLIGNDAFTKDDETSLWSRVPGVELDAGKKRKASSPDRHLGASHLHSHLPHPQYYQNNPYTNPGNVTYAHGLPTYSTEQKPSQIGLTSAGQNTQHHPNSSQSTGQPGYTAHTPAPAQLPPGYGNLSIPRPSNTTQQSTYSSPYARPPPSNPPAKVETDQTNGQTSTTPSATQSTAPTPAQQYQPKPAASSVEQREQLSPDIERAIAQFSTNMMNVLSERTPHAASIIEAATNRVRGIPVQTSVPGFESGMIRDMRRKQATTSASPAPSAPVQASPTPSPAPPNALEADIQERLKTFRKSMVAALKAKTDKAEIIVDSAINRARGFPHADKIPGWEQADELMVNAHYHKIQNASPSPANSGRTAVSQPAPRAIGIAGPATSTPAPTPVTPTAPHTPVNTSTTVPANTSTTLNSNPMMMARPNIPSQRPAPVTLNRPTMAGPINNPTIFQKDSVIGSGAALPTTPSVPRPNITGHRRLTEDSAQRRSQSASSVIPTNNQAISNATTPSTIVKSSSLGTNNRQSDTPTNSSSTATNNSPCTTTGTMADSGPGSVAGKSAYVSSPNTTSQPIAAVKMPGPVHNMSSPAPPSAGVVDQIAGHKRSLDDGPGSANAEQPEAKRPGVSVN
ncbi:hypothetical protein F4777DRAFT_587408 [Nemania sp. FL0916]|nr:hypothetical protein F4777DRAFT_587408 [Nemania sp. FL0916]